MLPRQNCKVKYSSVIRWFHEFHEERKYGKKQKKEKGRNMERIGTADFVLSRINNINIRITVYLFQKSIRNIMKGSLSYI